MDTPGANPHAYPHAHRVIAALNRDQVDYLDKIGKDAQFSSGTKLSRTQILAAMVNVLRRLNLTGVGIATIDEFEQRILDAMIRPHRAGRPRGRRNGAPGRDRRRVNGGRSGGPASQPPEESP